MGKKGYNHCEEPSCLRHFLQTVKLKGYNPSGHKPICVAIPVWSSDALIKGAGRFIDDKEEKNRGKGTIGLSLRKKKRQKCGPPKELPKTLPCRWKIGKEGLLNSMGSVCAYWD
jgi:hypothetical protein